MVGISRFPPPVVSPGGGYSSFYLPGRRRTNQTSTRRDRVLLKKAPPGREEITRGPVAVTYPRRVPPLPSLHRDKRPLSASSPPLPPA
jgi:hypothetical protein